MPTTMLMNSNELLYHYVIIEEVLVKNTCYEGKNCITFLNINRIDGIHKKAK